MIDPQYPYYRKLQKFLDKKQIAIYKNLTNKLSLIDSIDFNEVCVLKSSKRVLVMCYKGGIIKVIFQPSNIYKSELYFSHILYPIDICSFASLDGCMMFLPKYGESLNNCDNEELEKDYELLERDICSQLMILHSDFIVHNDIKPSNIVKSNGLHSKYNWLLIDFGLTETYLPSNPAIISLNSGTKDYNIPNYSKNINELTERERTFWMYMKDWYGASKTFCKFNKTIEKLYIYIDNMMKNKVLEILKGFVDKYKIKSKPYYLMV